MYNLLTAFMDYPRASMALGTAVAEPIMALLSVGHRAKLYRTMDLSELPEFWEVMVAWAQPKKQNLRQ